MSWADIGFNENLSIADVGQQGQQLDPAQVEQMIPEMSASKLSGFIKSQNGQLQMDLDGNSFVVTDGVVERVRFGKLLDGTYGLLIKNNNDQTLMQIGEKNIIQSPDQAMLLDFDNTQFLIKDAGLNPIILLGKQVNGF